MRQLILSGLIAASIVPASACAQDVEIDTNMALEHMRVLAADDMNGRLTGTEDAAMAREYIAGEYFMAGLLAFEETWDQPFTYRRPQNADLELSGINLVGYHPAADGSASGPAIVVTAHYDHIGNCNGQICNGADDNASGVAAMLAAASALANGANEHMIIFAALDAEENGLNGARELVEYLQGLGIEMALNINLDMLAFNEDNELAAAGAFHHPFLRAHIDAVEVPDGVTIIQGYDSPEWGPNGDWTFSSDHAAFHRAGIPWIYYGVDFHPHYHSHTDEFDVMHHDFFEAVTETVFNAIVYFDANLQSVVEAHAEADAAPSPSAGPDTSSDARPAGYTNEDGRYIKPGMEN
ncbi:M28 family peptidase [Hyphobacterium sp.]|uniref:M28 family peptidase n=1 Tax=Hyphobacterium sp. TaxID=2004662 RepID=UPI003BA9AB36